jgi:Uma2 family endonuclease
LSEPVIKDDVYAQFLTVPPYQVAEIIRGGLVTHPRPAARHATAASALGAELFGPFRRGKNGPGGWVILDEPELHLGRDILVPDIAAWRRERMPEIPDVTAFELAPDWICEVISPSTEATDRADKLPIYAQNRVLHAWLVDPITKTLEVFRLVTQRWTLLATYRDNDKVRAEPFDAVEIELGVLWER